MMNLSTGYGTYITAGLLFAATLAHSFKWIDDATYQSIVGVLGASGLTFLRSAVTASDEKNATANAIIAKAVDVKPAVIEENIGPQPAKPVK